MGTPLLFTFTLQKLTRRSRSLFPFLPAPPQKRAVARTACRPAAGQSTLLYSQYMEFGKKVRSFPVPLNGDTLRCRMSNPSRTAKPTPLLPFEEPMIFLFLSHCQYSVACCRILSSFLLSKSRTREQNHSIKRVDAPIKLYPNKILCFLHV